MSLASLALLSVLPSISSKSGSRHPLQRQSDQQIISRESSRVYWLTLIIGNNALYRSVTAIARSRLPECDSIHLLQGDCAEDPAGHWSISVINGMVCWGCSRNGMLDRQRANGIVYSQLVESRDWHGGWNVVLNCYPGTILPPVFKLCGIFTELVDCRDYTLAD